MLGARAFNMVHLQVAWVYMMKIIFYHENHEYKRREGFNGGCLMLIAHRFLRF